MERMRTYCLHRIDTDHAPLLGFVKTDTSEAALGELVPTIRAQQVGTIMELRTAHRAAITISNDIAHIYRYPDGTADEVVIWPKPSTLQ